MIYTTTQWPATIDLRCEGVLGKTCPTAEVIPAGSLYTVRQIPGRSRSRANVCEACAAVGRAHENAKAPVTAASQLAAATRAKSVARKYRTTSTSLTCRCRNCTSGRESLCPRD